MLCYVYKLVCEDTTSIYVGSTKNFTLQKAQYKYNCNSKSDVIYNNKLYKTIRENGGWENWKMVCLSNVEVEKITQMRAIVDEWRTKLNADLHSKMYVITDEQRKQKTKEYQKEYRLNNKEHIKEYQKEYQKCNKETIKEYQKEYQKCNKETIKQKSNDKPMCKFCGKFMFANNLKRHIKNKHTENQM